jgi:ABC-type phosphate/phosphonate transport system substrate-binding protein
MIREITADTHAVTTSANVAEATVVITRDAAAILNYLVTEFGSHIGSRFGTDSEAMCEGIRDAMTDAMFQIDSAIQFEIELGNA